MKTLVKKLVLAMVTTSMCTSLFVGCSTSKSEPANTTNKTETVSDKEGEKSDPQSGEQTVEKDMSPITLKAFFQTAPSWDTPVGKTITEKTGVTLEFVPVAGDPAEKLNLMLASNDLPDIVSISRGADANNKYITSKAVLPLDDLIANESEYITSQLGETMNKIRYEDGKIYGLPSWFMDDVQSGPVFGFNIRMNYVKELGYYDTYVEKGYFTQDEFYNLLKDWKEKYPKINGKETIPMTLNAENTGAYTLTFAGMYGVGSYYKEEGQLRSNYYNPKYKDMYMYINELYREGLIDKDWPVNKTALFDEKISNGYVLSAPAAYWDIKANSILGVDEKGNKTPDNMMYPFKVVADGVEPDQTTYGPTSVLGWTYTYITTANKNPERTMQFFDFMMSDEGQYINQWGPEGELWEMKDGKRTFIEEKIPALEKDMWAEFDKLGVRKYEILFKSGVAPDGQGYDLANTFNQIVGKQDPVETFARQYLGDSAWDTTLYDDLGPNAGSPEALMNTKIGDITKSTLPKVILAASEEEASKLYDDMIVELEKAGLEKIDKIANEKYQQKLEIWGRK